MKTCQKIYGDFEFPPSEVETAVKSGRLLSMEIEFSQECNYHCSYCYVAENASTDGEWSREKIRDVILQAKDLGARKIIVLGGEPMIYAHIEEMTRFIRENGLALEIFTNGTNVTEEMARFLFEHDVKVVLKMNTRHEALQDMMSGKKGASRIIRDAFESLKKAGYPAPGKAMAVSTIICRQNAGELPAMWQWLRDQGIEPYFEMITPQGKARCNDWLQIDSAEAEQIFKAIAEIDRARYGRDWDPQPPLVGNRCLRHQFSVFVNAHGDVMPCVGVTIPVGNVKERALREIIRDSEVIQNLRDYPEKIKGPCGACDHARWCYGCRGAAYQLTGDYLGSDPLCWRNKHRQEQIVRLPADLADVIPQKAPMRLVDRLMSLGERTAVVDVTIPMDSPFVGADGTLDDAVYVEMMAQSTAAMNGFVNRRKNGHKSKGLLLGARRVEILGQARAGDRLTVSMFKQAKFGEFGILTGTISRNGDVLARGEIKVWHTDDGKNSPADG